MIPTAMLRDVKVSSYAVMVYAVIASYGGYEIVAPRRETIAEFARCSVRKVADALNELEEIGVLERERRTNSKGQATTCYVLVTGRRSVKAHGAPTNEVKAHGAPGEGTSEQVTPLYTDREIEVEKSTRETLPPHLSFNEWWQQYPKKVDKGAARRAWTTALKKTSSTVLIAAAERYANDPNRDPQFTKNPATWLNAEAWENGPLPARSPQGGSAVENMLDRIRNRAPEGGGQHAIGA